MTKRLYIIGAGGFGREVLSWLQQMPEWGRDWSFSGFIEDNRTELEGLSFTPGIVGRIQDWQVTPGDAFVCAIGDPKTRLRITDEFSAQGAEFPIIKHPTATLGLGCKIGVGCILCPGTVITTNVTLGDFVIINANSTVGHDAQIGRGTTLSGHVDITGYAQLGEGVFAGSHASVLPKAKVGAYAKIGAGSVVLRSVVAGATVMGVPAKQILP